MSQHRPSSTLPIFCLICGRVLTEAVKNDQCSGRPGYSRSTRPSIFTDVGAIGERMRQIKREEEAARNNVQMPDK